MQYIIVAVLLFVLSLVYFKLADYFNIIDKPNHRSAHTEITVRGGGIIYPIAFLIFLASHFFLENLQFFPNILVLGMGLLVLATISFIDDITELSAKIRIVFHFIAVTLLLYFLNVFQELPIWTIPIIYIFCIGILNAYNFMDGINGMSGLYSLLTLGSLLYVNENVVNFTDSDFIIYPLLASIVFLFFNFRKKARCFMGDVGSMSIAFWILALLGILITKTGEIKWILFLTVYGVEVVLTILERLKLKENIFEAHRRHLYQLFANDKKISHLIVSSMYCAVQLVLNFFVIMMKFPDWMVILVVLLPTIIAYLFIKKMMKESIALDKIKNEN